MSLKFIDDCLVEIIIKRIIALNFNMMVRNGWMGVKLRVTVFYAG